MSDNAIGKVAPPLQVWTEISRDEQVSGEELSRLEKALVQHTSFTLADAQMVGLGEKLLSHKSYWQGHALPPLAASALELAEQRKKTADDGFLTFVVGANIGWAGAKIPNPMAFLLVAGISWLVMADGIASLMTGLPPIVEDPEEILEVLNSVTGK